MAKRESNFNPEQISQDGHDYGLMQIRDINHEYWRKALGMDLDYLNPYDNVLVAIKVIGGLSEKYDGDERTVLMCYNMGENKAMNRIRNGQTTSDYAEEVIAIRDELRSESWNQKNEREYQQSEF